MTFDFYLFDVDRGQSAAARLPNGRWCIFDVGCSAKFSPIQFIISKEIQVLRELLPPWVSARKRPFLFLKATISHLHGDHLDDYLNLFAALPESLKTVDFDKEYLLDVLETTSKDSLPKVIDFCRRYFKLKRSVSLSPDIKQNYGVAKINEKSLPLSIVRKIGGTANNIVNNASIITRIDCHRNSILICGDMEEDAWEFVLNNPLLRSTWRKFVGNIDILIAPHHGHCYSSSLMGLANPSVVLISVVSKDESIDSRYTNRVTTRDKGNIRLSIAPNPTFPLSIKGKRTWSYGQI